MLQRVEFLGTQSTFFLLASQGRLRCCLRLTGGRLRLSNLLLQLLDGGIARLNLLLELLVLLLLRSNCVFELALALSLLLMTASAFAQSSTELK